MESYPGCQYGTQGLFHHGFHIEGYNPSYHTLVFIAAFLLAMTPNKLQTLRRASLHVSKHDETPSEPAHPPLLALLVHFPSSTSSADSAWTINTFGSLFLLQHDPEGLNRRSGSSKTSQRKSPSPSLPLICSSPCSMATFLLVEIELHQAAIDFAVQPTCFA